MTMRPISTDGFKVTPLIVDVGAAPDLQWIDIDKLVVDETYQRPIARAGRANIIKIASVFRWSYFAAVVVSPIEGGKYSIVDGQHRVTAAMIRGIKSVPCQVVIADRQQQAAAFRAINGVQTAMTPLALHHAEIVAGSKEALDIADCCKRGGVTIIRSTRVASELQAGQTYAVSTLKQCLKLYGRDTLITALMCITKSRCNKPGALSSNNISAICWALQANHQHRDSGAALFAVFDKIDLHGLYKQAGQVTAETKSVTRCRAMAQLIGEILEKHLFGTRLMVVNG